MRTPCGPEGARRGPQGTNTPATEPVGALGCPRVIAEPGTHGTSLLCTSNTTARLGRATVPAPLALALAATVALCSPLVLPP